MTKRRSNRTPELQPGKFRKKLLGWYDRHKRDLPWRQSSDPYRVWVSEIMLQQTRVAAVIEHYRRFLQLFPSLERLAAASESAVLAAWSGLGYYRRARMLHAAARQLAGEGKCLPHSAAALGELPGIGRYTAAAIASIAFGEPVAVVDGNVERVLSRVLGKTLNEKATWTAAQELLDPQRPGDFNQAMMELGATVCLPGQPHCLACPVVGDCATRGEGKIAASSVRQNKREIRYCLSLRTGSVFLLKRAATSSLMPGMWELPESTALGENWRTFKHSITTTDYVVRVSRGPAPAGVRGRWIKRSRLSSLPLTGLARKILRAANDQELLSSPPVASLPRTPDSAFIDSQEP